MKVLNFIAVVVGTAFWCFCIPFTFSMDGLLEAGAMNVRNTDVLSNIVLPVVLIILTVGFGVAIALRSKINKSLFNSGIQLYQLMFISVLCFFGMDYFVEIWYFGGIIFLIMMVSALVFLVWLAVSIFEIIIE